MSAIQTTPVISLKNIMFATDFSAASEQALPFLRSLARQFGSTVYVAYVGPGERHYEVPLDPLPAEYQDRRLAAEAQMRAFVQVHDLGSLPLQTVVEQGEVWPALAQVASDSEIDLIIVGTHGRRAFSNVLLGSVAEDVIRHSPCPVLTVGPHVSLSDAAPGTFEHILFATNFSAASDHALAYALLLVQADHARMTMLHVVEQASTDVALPYPQQEIEDAQQRLEQMIPDTVDMPVPSDLVVEVGVPADTILEVAQRTGADLIIMGAHRKVGTHVPWHAVHHVICHAHCPVLTVNF